MEEKVIMGAISVDDVVNTLTHELKKRGFHKVSWNGDRGGEYIDFKGDYNKVGELLGARPTQFLHFTINLRIEVEAGVAEFLMEEEDARA